MYHRVTKPIIETQKLAVLDTYIQHGTTTTLEHSMAVAYYSLVLVCTLRIRCDYESLIRGALLHDYFLYDWHCKDDSHRLHGFTHHRAALNNANRDFKLNDIERDIIGKHMFPLVPRLPRYIESVVVCLVDKYCTLREVFASSPYTNIPVSINVVGKV
jgi:uncharacterized protein